MEYKTLGFWRTLEFIPGLSAVDAYWKFRFGNDYKFGKLFLRPNGKTAASHPCIYPNVCGCDHDVVVHDVDDIVAVCNCGRECDNFTLQQPDLVIYELNRPMLDSALAAVLKLSKESDRETDIHGTTRVGNISQNSGLRFPVFLTTQLEKQDFANVVDGLLSRNDTPFILLAPTRKLCTSKTEKRLNDRKSSFIPLSENVAITDNQQFKLLRPLKDILSQFVKLNFTTNSNYKSQPSSHLSEEYLKDGHIFKRQGNTWLVVFKGKTININDSKGMRHICQLLQNQGQEIHAATLQGVVTEDGVTPIHEATIDILDDKARRDYISEIKDIAKEREIAESNNDQSKILLLNEKTELLETELRGAKGLNGRNRAVSNNSERARQAVSKAIHTAMRSIENEHESLWKHLDNSLKIGQFLSYQPEKPTSWYY